MKSIRRCQSIITLFLVLFIAGMTVLVVKINREAPFYMMHSGKHELGMVYDRNGDVLFDGLGQGTYEDNHFIDIGNIIGDDKGQMNNTLVAQNIDKLNNYSFSAGLVREGGKAAIYTTLDHAANRAVYNAYMGAKGCTVAYNYKTGEILVCTSLPSIDFTKGYENIGTMESGTLLSKTLFGTVPGSTQKVSTVATALEIMGPDLLFSKSYTCNGQYLSPNFVDTANTGEMIICHQSWGHGTQNIQQAVENSCNPFFAQLVEDPDMPLDRIIEQYRKLGFAVNDDEMQYLDIDGIQCERASTELKNKADPHTQWGCIGQGDTLVSPIQLMMWQSAIANGTGKMTMPHLIHHVTNLYGDTRDVAVTSFSDEIFSPTTADTVKRILLTNGANHYAWSIPNYIVGVKSGTAQVNNGQEENSLLVGFLSDDQHPIAFCILLENKFSTSVTTEQIATTLLNALCQ